LNLQPLKATGFYFLFFFTKLVYISEGNFKTSIIIFFIFKTSLINN
jgi:hypothetical protein